MPPEGEETKSEGPEDIEALLIEALASEARLVRRSPAAWHPADDAERVRRLLAAADGRLPGRLLLRAFALLKEAGATGRPRGLLFASRAILADSRLAALLGEALPDFAAEAADDDGAAIARLADDPRALAAVTPSAPWLEPLMAAGGPRVVAAFPCAGSGGPPRLLILGRLVARPTGQDETLVASRGGLPRAFAPGPLWEIAGTDWHLTALPGFLSAESLPLIGLTRSNDSLALRVLGRYPSPFEVPS
jgi:hypothetical protein